MIRPSALLAPLAALFVCAAQALDYGLVVDPPAHVCRCGENAAFCVTATEKGARVTNGTVEVTLDWCGTSNVLTRCVDLARENPFRVSGTLAQPGFLRLQVKEGARRKTLDSVGFEPERLRQGKACPADFDAFWAAARARLDRDVPLDARVTPVAELTTAEWDYYRISFATFGRRVHGYMSIPKDRAKGPFPLEVSVAAAGFGGWTNCMQGHPKRVRVFFSVYPFEPDWKFKENGLKAKYDALHAKGSWFSAGFADERESSSYYPVILGITRALDWLVARPEVDRRGVTYSGTSQGGGFGTYLMGLTRHFTRGCLFVPALTDVLGCATGRRSGWPQPYENEKDAARRERILRNAAYYDGANFAARITCPIRVVVGFADDTCPPWAVYSAYNAMPSKDKRILHGFGMGHGVRGEFYSFCGAWEHDTHPSFSPSAEGMRLIWSDEFDGAALDPKKWVHEIGFVRNKEPQWYSDARSNVRVENGVLVLEARRERVKNPNYVAGDANWQKAREYAEYTSGSVQTRGRFNFQYGRIDVRAKLPPGHSVWPAIWTLGAEKSWPWCGEMDIMEYYGFLPGDPQGCFHWGSSKAKSGHGHTSQGPSHCPGRNPTEGFHLYTMEWTPERVVLRYDGDVYHDFLVAKADNPDGSNPFRKPHFILLDFALRAAHGGRDLLAADVFPQRFEIDFVRVYAPAEQQKD